MTHSLGVMIETLVALLLIVTIGYCMLLNARLKRLKADEYSLKAVIGELIIATEIAERAIGGLKLTVRDVNEHLGSQIASATEMSEHLKQQLAEGDQVVRRLSSIAIAARPVRTAPEPEAPKASARTSDLRTSDLRASVAKSSVKSSDVKSSDVKASDRASDVKALAAAAQAFSDRKRSWWSRCMKSYRDIRVIPVVVAAIFGLAVLKVAGLVIDGGYVFDYNPKSTKKSWAQEMLNFPGKEDQGDITGSTQEKPKEEAPKPAAPETKSDGATIRPEEAQPQVHARGARDPGAAADAPAGAGGAGARNRHSREPVEGGGKAHRRQGRGNEGR